MRARTLSVLAIAVAIWLGGGVAYAAPSEDWKEYRNERFGLNLLYPTDVFTPDRAAEAGDGQLFQSEGGRARLLIGALVNESGFSPASYQNYIARKSYSQYQIDYRPLGQNWFVLSGAGNGRIFYEKVMFSCGGRLINSFALLYSADERAKFDVILERMEKSFQPGQNCQEAGIQPTPSPRAERAAALYSGSYERSPMADRIARARGRDVLVVLRRTSPPYDYKIVRGSAARP
jgi:hypothetical protein